MNNKQPMNRVNQSEVTIKAGFADGHVIHSRQRPKVHRFKNNMCWCLFDLDNLGDWFAQSKLWGHNKWSLFGLNDDDYVDARKRPIKEKLLRYICQQTGQAFSGQVMLFTHPRFLGYGFNSVSFYFCYQEDEAGQNLAFIVSEINNTPWGEKHLYLHDCSKAKQTPSAAGDVWTFEFEKQFHISPFMDMQMSYRWDFKVTAEQISVNMWVKKQADTLLTVVLDTKITPLVENKANGFLLRRPFQPWKMSMGIYWQAFKLWCKRIPFYTHPKSTTELKSSEGDTPNKRS